MHSKLLWVRLTTEKLICIDCPPLGPRTRAPLGAKTTNAKAKAYHIPPPPSAEDVPEKSPQKSASARKSKPRVSHAEMTKLDIHGDLDELREREIEYMPPPPKREVSVLFIKIHVADRTKLYQIIQTTYMSLTLPRIQTAKAY